MRVKEKPILFNSEMVSAILSGQKTQTRRIIKNSIGDGTKENPIRMDLMECPYGQVGDELWIKETYWSDRDTGELISYCASEPNIYDDNHTVKKTPSMHMPRKLSRIQLKINDIRIERLQQITYQDALNEGCPLTEPCPLNWFAELWCSIKGSDSWDQNPWIWVIEFEKVDK